MKRIRLDKKCVLAVAGILALAGCSSDSSTSSDSASSTGSISSVPKATGPVNGTGASALEAASAMQSGLSSSSVHAAAATTGVKLTAWNKSSRWTSSTSRAMCETGSLMRDAFDGAMQPDKIACYVGAIQSAGLFGSTTVDSGEYIYFKLKNLPDSASYQPRIKMKIVKTSGAITTFEMFSCFDNSTGTTQTEYLNSVISDGSVAITAKNIGSQGTSSWGSSTSVSGAVDSSYNWNSKSITVSRSYSDTANSATFSQNAEITQKTSNFVLSGYNKGSWGTGVNKQIWTNAFYTVIQGLNMTTPKAVALGDGSGKYSMNYCLNPQGGGGTSCNGSETTKFSGTGLDSWDGDTYAKLGTASSGAYYSTANAGSVPSSTPDVSVSFGTGQTWDCTASSFVEVDLSNFANTSTTLGAAISSCDAKYSFQNDNDATDGYACGSAQ